jgi:hypothetical protein
LDSDPLGVDDLDEMAVAGSVAGSMGMAVKPTALDFERRLGGVHLAAVSDAGAAEVADQVETPNGPYPTGDAFSGHAVAVVVAAALPPLGGV